MTPEQAQESAEHLGRHIKQYRNNALPDRWQLIRDFYAGIIIDMADPESWGPSATRQGIAKVVANMVSTQLFLYNRARLIFDERQFVEELAFLDLPEDLPLSEEKTLSHPREYNWAASWHPRGGQ